MPTPTWTTTTLLTGPLASNSYTMTIPNLSANTKYEYRAYFIVNGIAYYGNTLTGSTLPVPPVSPTVCTGVVGTVLSTKFPINNNKVCTIGSSPINEYGILYTQLSSWGTNCNLIYSNSSCSALVKINSTCSTIGAGSCFCNCACHLSPNTMTYYRAFVKNSAGLGYGVIKCQQTAPPSQINLCMFASNGGDGTTISSKCACFYSTPVMTAGECYCVTLNIDLHNSYTSAGSYSSISVVRYPIGTCLSCCISGGQDCYTGSLSFPFCAGDLYCITATAAIPTTACANINTSSIFIGGITNIVGGYAKGTTCTCICAVTG